MGIEFFILAGGLSGFGVINTGRLLYRANRRWRQLTRKFLRLLQHGNHVLQPRNGSRHELSKMVRLQSKSLWGDLCSGIASMRMRK